MIYNQIKYFILEKTQLSRLVPPISYDKLSAKQHNVQYNHLHICIIHTENFLLIPEKYEW